MSGGGAERGREGERARVREGERQGELGHFLQPAIARTRVFLPAGTYTRALNRSAHTRLTTTPFNFAPPRSESGETAVAGNSGRWVVRVRSEGEAHQEGNRGRGRRDVKGARGCV